MKAIQRFASAVALGLLLSAQASADLGGNIAGNETARGGGVFTGYTPASYRWSGFIYDRESRNRSGHKITESHGASCSTEATGPESIANLGPLGYHFIQPPEGRIVRMRVVYENGTLGLMEWTGSRDRILVRLEKGLNRVQFDLVGRDRKSAKKIQCLYIWSGT